MRRIAIITATPPSVNPGMLACEATARSFVARHGLLEQTTFFRTYPQSQWLGQIDAAIRDQVISTCKIGIDFEILSTVDQLENFVPLYWGDFLHMRRYHEAISHMFMRAEEDVRDLLLLASAPTELRQRAISFATSLLFNGTRDYAEGEYASSLWRFFGDCAHVQMRDAISAGLISAARASAESCFGLDAAQLLSIDDCILDVMGNISEVKQERIIVFFSRGKHDTKPLLQFLDEFSKALKLPINWLEWGDKYSFPYRDPEFTRFEVVDLDRKFDNHLQRLLDQIRKSWVVITDTYHLCVVAWALGVPCLLIPGDYHNGEISSKLLERYARHDKRKVLLGQDGLMDFFIDERILNSAHRKDVINSLVQSIADSANSARIRARLARRAQRSEIALFNALAESCSQ